MMKNKYKIINDTLIVYNRKDNREMLFDAEDFDLISKHTWCIDDKGYAVTNPPMINSVRGSLIYAHKLLLKVPKGKLVDHQNRIRLDYRKNNLRIVTHKENNENRSNVKGCYFHKASQKWMARINVNKKEIYLGIYETEKEAIEAYKKAKKLYHT